MERCGTQYSSIITITSMVETLDECLQFCLDRGQYAYGVECPETINGKFQMKCQCYPIDAWYFAENILPLKDCMGEPTTVLTVSPQYNGNNRQCTGPYLQNGQGTGGACRSMIRRTS